ncbi:MAG: hypothetical protein Q8N17_26610 [Burkholderiaceae bacterium]|nr:hypothetical protein [Burkholderiaceae bacterium]
MILLLLEALGALAALLLIVWWTMFSGRKNGEPPGTQQDPGARDDKADPSGRD